LLERTRSSGVRLAVWVLLLLCVVEQVNVVSNHNLSRAEEMAALRSVPASMNCKSFYVLPHSLERGATIQQVNAMLIAQVVNVPTLNGYSGWFPAGWQLYETDRPSYRSNAWRWAASHGVADGLCEYDVARREWRQVREDSVLQAVGAVQPGTSIDFRVFGDGDPYRLEGWSRPEVPGTWTDGPAASLAAKITEWPAADMIMQVIAQPFLVRDRHASLQVEIEVNGSVVDRWSYRYGQDDKDFVMRSARVPASLLAGASLLNVKFRINQPARPKMLGVHPTDDRSLGLFFSRVSFNAAASEGNSER
jgi:hypothetical protein